MSCFDSGYAQVEQDVGQSGIGFVGPSVFASSSETFFRRSRAKSVSSE